MLPIDLLVNEAILIFLSLLFFFAARLLFSLLLFPLSHVFWMLFPVITTQHRRAWVPEGTTREEKKEKRVCLSLSNVPCLVIMFIMSRLSLHLFLPHCLSTLTVSDLPSFILSLAAGHALSLHVSATRDARDRHTETHTLTCILLSLLTASA